MPKNVNDWIALAILLLVIPGLWVLAGRGIIQLPGDVLGATIAAWTLVLQYYFRKSPPSGGTGNTPAPPAAAAGDTAKPHQGA